MWKNETNDCQKLNYEKKKKTCKFNGISKEERANIIWICEIEIC